MGDGASKQRSLAEKLDHLFGAVRPAKGQYTHQQVAVAIEAAGGATISATYVWQLRNGKRDNPTMHHLEALSAFFGVPPTYFFDDEAAASIDVELLTSLRDASVRELALRASGLSKDSLGAIADLVDRLRVLEGLSSTSATSTSDNGSA